MQKFERLRSSVAALPQDDIDTDIIYPARFLLLTDRTGLGPYAFYDWRVDGSGAPAPQFVLNRSPWDRAQILVAGKNFGCGSSREQALWALAGQGFRCVIAPSFGDIFYGNCFKNGILPIVLPALEHARVMGLAQGGSIMTVDLAEGTIDCGDEPPIPFELDARRRAALLNGWDELDVIRLTHGASIGQFENDQRIVQPWLWRTREQAD